MVHLYDKSKKGTKEKTMFERLKNERPELVLKLINDTVNDIPTNDNLIEYIRENEREKYKEEIKTKLGDPKAEAKLMKVYADIANGTFKMSASNYGKVKTLIEKGLIEPIKMNESKNGIMAERIIYKIKEQ